MKKNQTILAVLMVCSAFVKLCSGFLVGYYPPLFWLWLLWAPASLACVSGVFLGVGFGVVAVRRREPFARFILVWILAGAIGILPCFLPSVLGGITRAKVIGTGRIVQEGRSILAIHDEPWGNDAAWQSVDDPPPALRRLHGAAVRVFRDPRSEEPKTWYIEVKMYGLGDFAGFHIVREDEESPVGLRIADGLYWSDDSGYW